MGIKLLSCETDLTVLDVSTHVVDVLKKWPLSVLDFIASTFKTAIQAAWQYAD